MKTMTITQPKQAVEPFKVTDSFVIGTARNRKGQVNSWSAWLSNKRHVAADGSIMKDVVVNRETCRPYTINWSTFNGEGIIDGETVKIVNGFTIVQSVKSVRLESPESRFCR